MTNIKKLSNENYKGTRDFYPEDYFIQNYIFKTWSKAVSLFGFERYDASLIESSDIYKAKSGEELINEQTYTFIDRGEREITLRPEMTPTLARLIAKKKRELPFPQRLYSIPNCFRYERPQRGRLREFWQLNVDILNKRSKLLLENKKDDSIFSYDIEILKVAYTLMATFGAKKNDFTIKINSRSFLNNLYNEYYNVDNDMALKLSKLIDKKDKIKPEDFVNELKSFTDKKYINANDNDFLNIIENLNDTNESFQYLIRIKDTLSKMKINNVEIDLSVVRGLDYYTGLVFEIYDNNPENNRALFGGGRYENLVDVFENNDNETIVSGIGFGLGDVPMLNFLESRGLIPEYKPKTDVYIFLLNDIEKYEDVLNLANDIASILRDQGIKVAVKYEKTKYSDGLKNADKMHIKRVIALGDDELSLDINKIIEKAFI